MDIDVDMDISEDCAPSVSEASFTGHAADHPGGQSAVRVNHLAKLSGPGSGQTTASSNEVTHNARYCWEYTPLGLHSGFSIHIICPASHGLGFSSWHPRTFRRFDD